MNLVKTEGDRFYFELGKREKRLLLEVLRFYPLIPPEHHEFTRSDEEDPTLASTRKLLQESLAEEKRENRNALEALLREEDRFVEDGAGYRLQLSASETEWLLQILNEIRVGSWIVLGRPDPGKQRSVPLDEKTVPYFWAMELCVYFEYALIHALGRTN